MGFLRMPEYRTIHSFGEDIVTSLPEHIDSKDICLCYACARFNPNTNLNCPIAQANYELAKRYNLRVPVVACGNFSSIEGTFVDDNGLDGEDDFDEDYDSDEDDGFFIDVLGLSPFDDIDDTE